jgi:hypothetical protein
MARADGTLTVRHGFFPQGTFLRAFERIGCFGPWFMKVVVNDAVKAAARRERTLPLEENQAPACWLMDSETGPQDLAVPAPGPHPR